MNTYTSLIPVTEGSIANTSQQLCNARDLHAFLEVGKDFATWIKGRIEQFEFVENQDFVTFITAPQNGGAGNRGLRIEYHLSLDMAKELSMVERTAKGKEARQYFIKCERIVLEELRRTPDLPSLDDLPICMYLPEDVAICCVGDDGSIKTGFKMDSWSNSRQSRLVIGFETRRFNAMSDSKIDPPHPDIFRLPLWIEMRGRYAFV